jgi:hypothetical protein
LEFDVKGCVFFEVGKGFLNVVNFVLESVNRYDVYNVFVFQTNLIAN